ncbi:MAG: hypothetical protein K1X67_02545 [Fimbriimonadaceae bacterium]|nr:hypothetical protein [Fimbriimonadaceae bacterium]
MAPKEVNFGVIFWSGMVRSSLSADADDSSLTACIGPSTDCGITSDHYGDERSCFSA